MITDYREDCILHANCQGEPLAVLLGASPDFSSRWRIRQYTNYTREAIPDSTLQNATLFLYQHLGQEWGGLASASLLSRLSAKAVPVCIPNMFFSGYWPFWTSDSPMDFGDVVLDKLIAAGAGKPEIMRIYLYGDVRKLGDLDECVARTLRLEKQKEKRCCIRTADFVEANWKTTRLFQTVNHPDVPLLVHAAQKILAHLGLAPIPESFLERFSYEYEGFSLPIHPGVAASHMLAFGGEAAEYPIFGRTLTFAQYVSRYIDCRMNGLEDNFLGYLQLV